MGNFPIKPVRESNSANHISSVNVIPDSKCILLSFFVLINVWIALLTLIKYTAPPESSVVTPEDPSPKKTINIISDVVVVPSTSAKKTSILNSENYLTNGICFICTYNLRLGNAGLKCRKCCRTFHVTCLMKYYKNCPNYNPGYFVCSVCDK